MDNLLDNNYLLERSLSDTNLELEDLRGKFSALENLHEALNGEISTYAAEKKVLMSQADDRTQTISALSEKNLLLEDSLSVLNSEVESLRIKLKGFDESFLLLNEEKSDLLLERKSLLAQIETLTHFIEELSEKKLILEKSLSAITNDVLSSMSKLKDKEDCYQSLQEKNSGLLDERDTLLSQVKILTKDVENLLGKNSALDSSLSDVTKEVCDLRKKLKDIEESYESLSHQNSRLLTERNTLLTQRELFTLKNSSLETSLISANDEVDSLRLKLKDLEESLQFLSDQNSCHLSEKNSLLSELEVLTQDADKLSESNSSLKNSLSNISSEVVCLRSKLKDFTESCQSLRDHNSLLLAERNALISQTEDLTQNVKKLSQENSFFENSLISLTIEVSCLSSKLKDFKDSFQFLSDQNSSLLDEKRALLSEIDILMHNVHQLSEKSSFLKISLSDVSSEVVSLRSKLNDSENSCQSERDQNFCLVNERDALVSQTEVLSQSVEKLSQKNSFLENSLTAMSTEIELLSPKLKILEENCQSLSDQNSSVLAEKNILLSEVEILTQDMEKLSHKNSYLENSLANLSNQVGCLDSKLKEYEESYQSVKDQNSDLLIERSVLVSQAGVLSQNVENLSQKHSLLENSLVAVTTEVECLRSKLSNSEESCQSLRHQNSDLFAQRNTLISEVDVLAQNVEELSKKNSLLDNSFSDVSTRFECSIIKLKDSERSCKSLSDQRSHLLAERDSLLSQVETLTISVNDLSEKNSFLENSLSNVSTEVGFLRSKLKDSEDSFQTVSDQNGDLLSERNTLVSRIEILSQDMDKVSEKYSFLENLLSDLNTEVECLRSKLKDSEESGKSLREKNACLLAERENLLSQLEVLTNNMENLSGHNSLLEINLYDARSEVCSLTLKLKEMEDSCQLHNAQNSDLLSERKCILFQLEAVTQNAEKLSDKNSILESDLSDVRTEIDFLKSKLKDFEGSCQSLHNQNSALLSERDALVSQVGNITANLKNLDSSFVVLETKYLKAAEESVLTTNQIKNLQDRLELEKEEYRTLIQSCESQMAAFEDQIFLLQQENKLIMVEHEAAQSHLIGASVENFVLQRSLCDVHARNLSLCIELKENKQACRRAEVLVSDLEMENLIQVEKRMSLKEQNKRLCKAINLLQSTLIIDKSFDCLNEVQDEVLLDMVVENILAYVSGAEHNNQLLQLEISVLVILLKHAMLDLNTLELEKCSLERELAIKTTELLALGNKEQELLELNLNLSEDIESRSHKEVEIKIENEVLSRCLTELQESLMTFKCEILSLTEENKILIENLCILRQKCDMLEEENIEVLSEAAKLDHLCLFFNSLCAERVSELKWFTSDIDSLHHIKNGLVAKVYKKKGVIRALKEQNAHLIRSLTFLEEDYRSHILLSEFDLITTACFCKELNFEWQSLENKLLKTQLQLSETIQKTESIQLENYKLGGILQELRLDNETGKMVKEQLEQKISNLSQVVADRNQEMKCVYKANEKLQVEIDQNHTEIGILLSRKEDLLSELQIQIHENDLCQVEMEALSTEIHLSTVTAVLYEEKFHELIIEGELSTILQKETLMIEVKLIKEFIDTLKKKVNYLEGRSYGLEVDLGVYEALVTSLWNSIASLGDQIIELTKVRSAVHHDNEENQPRQCQTDIKVKSNQMLEKLIPKVEFLRNLIKDIQSDVEQENFEATEGIERLKKKELRQQEVQLQQNFISQFDGVNDAEISKGKTGEMMKDIQLDKDSSSLPYGAIGSFGLSGISNKEIDDQLWETAESNFSNQKLKASTTAMENDIEPVEEEKSEYPSSELMVEKELSIDKLEVPNRVPACQKEWNKRVLERLKSDVQRLSDLKTNVIDLKRKLESSQTGKLPASFSLDTIKTQLKNAEESLLELFDTNKKLRNKALEHSSDAVGAESEESSRTVRKKMSEEARKQSEKVGRLELELHKIQYVLLKLEEEQMASHTQAVDRRARTLLRDYIYGRRGGNRRTKKSPFCGCMRPKTKNDQ